MKKEREGEVKRTSVGFRARLGLNPIHSGNRYMRSDTGCQRSARVGRRSTKQTRSGFSNAGKAFRYQVVRERNDKYLLFLIYAHSNATFHLREPKCSLMNSLISGGRSHSSLEGHWSSLHATCTTEARGSASRRLSMGRIPAVRCGLHFQGPEPLYRLTPA